MESNQVIFYSVSDVDTTALATKLGHVGMRCMSVALRADAEREIVLAQPAILVCRSERLTEDIVQLLKFVGASAPRTQVIVSLQEAAVEDAVGCMQAGASDFAVGELSDARITESILRCQSHVSGRHQHTPSASQGGQESEPILIGQSHSICEIRSAINLVAKSQTTVLITGESGTGKEVISRLIHVRSNRSKMPFIALNCAALPKDVIENELFGHERGAFTGALVKKAGCFELADTGTLFFDEIAEMNFETQAKLLRALETQKFRRLGGKEEVSVNVRMIAATNKNVTEALHANHLREDLYYRLSVIEIFIPPLRERKEDVPLLVNYFLNLFSKNYGKPVHRFDEQAMELMKEYRWPGNVREIRNVVERALVICPQPVIGPQYLPEKVRRHLPERVQINIPMGISSDEAERILILRTLASAGNNKSKTARILGLSRKTLHNKLAKYSDQ